METGAHDETGCRLMFRHYSTRRMCHIQVIRHDACDISLPEPQRCRPVATHGFRPKCFRQLPSLPKRCRTPGAAQPLQLTPAKWAASGSVTTPGFWAAGRRFCAARWPAGSRRRLRPPSSPRRPARTQRLLTIVRSAWPHCDGQAGSAFVKWTTNKASADRSPLEAACESVVHLVFARRMNGALEWRWSDASGCRKTPGSESVTSQLRSASLANSGSQFIQSGNE